MPEAQRQKYAPKHSHCVTKREKHLRDFVSTPAIAEVLPASSAWYEVYTQSSAGDNPQVFHRQEGAEDLTNLHQDCCAKGKTSKDKYCHYIKDFGLTKQSAEVLPNFPLLGQGNKMFTCLPMLIPSSATPGRQDTRIVPLHLFEHGKRQVVSQYKVKSGRAEGIRPSGRALTKTGFGSQAAASQHLERAHAGPYCKELADMWM